MAYEPHPHNDADSDDEVLLLMTLRTVVELMGDDIESPQRIAPLPDEVTGFIDEAEVSQLKQLLLRATMQLSNRLAPAQDENDE